MKLIVLLIYVSVALFILWAIGYGVIYITQYVVDYNQAIEGIK